ncbi:CFA74 protein, partial [Pitta sordida]|nr:CFA74 protein [Pitta sordida]
GHGVLPGTVCSVEGVLDMGYVLARDKVTATVQVQNPSSLALPFSIQLDSLSPTRDRDRQRIPAFLTPSGQRTEIVGTQNYSGLSVFSVFPTQGQIEAGKSQEFVVTFSPDHASLYYSDRLRVVLFGERTAHEIRLKGAARDVPLFVEGGAALDVPVESLAVAPPLAPQEPPTAGEPPRPLRSLLLLLELQDGGDPARAELRLGAVPTPGLAATKVRDMAGAAGTLALLVAAAAAPPAQNGPCKLKSPPAGLVGNLVTAPGAPSAPLNQFSCGVLLQVSDPPLLTALLTLKGDNVTECYRLLFMTRVVSA